MVPHEDSHAGVGGPLNNCMAGRAVTQVAVVHSDGPRVIGSQPQSFRRDELHSSGPLNPIGIGVAGK